MQFVMNKLLRMIQLLQSSHLRITLIMAQR